MNYKHSLKFRITFSFVIFAALLSALFSTGVYFAIEDIEQELMETSLETELAHFLESTELEIGNVKQISASITRYYVPLDDLGLIPPYLRGLAPGIHEVKHNENRYHVLVNHLEKGAIYVIKDVTQFEQREIAIQYALGTMMLIAPLVALWLGVSLSGRVISPVANLARHVSQLVPGRHAASPVAQHYARDEVGQLAATFDRYLEQLEEFVEREQEFTANASHELRTPMTIINGAAELLLDNTELPGRAQRQVERIARAGTRMAQMIEVLLLLAREPLPDDEGELKAHCSLKEVCLEVCEQNRFLTNGKALTLRSEIIHDSEIVAPKAIVSILLGNLVRNALTYTEEGEVMVTVDKKRIEVRDTGPGIAEDQLEQIFERHYRSQTSTGSGIGLAIVKRICERQRWEINIESEVGRGTAISLDFSAQSSKNVP